MGDETRWKLLHGDSREVLPTLEENSLHACVTDPPYGLVPDGFGTIRNGAYAGCRRGFMGKAWDGTGIEKDPTFWVEVFRVLRPGAHLVAFGGTRTSHRIACAIEDAGFEIRDTILSMGTLGFTAQSLAWVHGQGFPKRHDQLKPAFEPILLCRKPLSESSISANVLKWGCGGLNIAATRVGNRPGEDYTVTRLKPGATLCKTGGNWRPEEGGVPYHGKTQDGRFPPNVLLTHHAGCARRAWGQGSLIDAESVTPNGHDPGKSKLQHSRGKRQFGYRDDGDEWECVPQCAVAELARQSGETVSRRAVMRGEDGGNVFAFHRKEARERGHDDEGTAARFFPQFSYDDADFHPFHYCAKAARSERDKGLDGVGKPPPFGGGKGVGSFRGLSNTRQDKLVQNNHPTVKPLSLLSWLVKLTTPPGGTVLDPFLGSGGTAVACLKEGFRFIGIEREEEYLDIARGRLQQQLPFLFDETDGPPDG